MYDNLIVDAACPHRGVEQVWSVQYKYGCVYAKEKRVGDPIDWLDHRSDHGTNCGGEVAVSGIAERDCSRCGKRPYARIVVTDNVITSATLSTEDPPLLEVVRPAAHWIEFLQTPSPGSVLEAFIDYCGPARIYHLHLARPEWRHEGRLKTWQEQLVVAFCRQSGVDLEPSLAALAGLLAPIVRVYELPGGG